MPPPSTRPHSRGDARQAIVDTARDLFVKTGYDGTSVRDVATSAKVSEGLVYRYFGSKSNLFDASVAESLRGFIAEFLDQWQQIAAGVPNEEVVDRYVRGLYRVVTENSSLLFTLSAAERFGSDGSAGTGVLTGEVRKLAEMVSTEARERGIEHVDLEMAVACTTALVLSMGLLDNLLFDKGTTHPDPERLLREMSKFASAGVRASSSSSSSSSSSPPLSGL